MKISHVLLLTNTCLGRQEGSQGSAEATGADKLFQFLCQFVPLLGKFNLNQLKILVLVVQVKWMLGLLA